MKIVINTAHQRFGGAIQVALSLIYEFRKFNKHEYHVWLGYGLSKLIETKDFGSNFHFYNFNFGIINFSTLRKIQKTLSQEEKKIKPDIIVASSGPSYYHSKAPQIIGYTLPLHIYPESPFLKGLSFKSRLKNTLKKIAHFYFYKRDAKAILAQTDDVRDRIKKALNVNNVYTITNTANTFFQKKKTFKNKLPEKNEKIFRFLTISSYYPHKNLELIPLVLKQLEKYNIKNVEFVLTLKQNDFLNKVGKHKRIINIGPVKPVECPSLYEECDALFLPTLAECFSASYPEAMIMQKPIITTNLGFAKSICGKAAIYYEPKNELDAALKIKQLLNNKNLQLDLVKNGVQQLNNFDSPEQRAKKYLEICENIVNNGRKA